MSILRQKLCILNYSGLWKSRFNRHFGLLDPLNYQNYPHDDWPSFVLPLLRLEALGNQGWAKTWVFHLVLTWFYGTNWGFDLVTIFKRLFVGKPLHLGKVEHCRVWHFSSMSRQKFMHLIFLHNVMAPNNINASFVEVNQANFSLVILTHPDFESNHDPLKIWSL